MLRQEDFNSTNPILYSIRMFWTSTFILPKKVIHVIEQYFNHFLWKGKCHGNGDVRVAWDKVCLPKQGGGLGLKRVHDWNKASILKHIWHLFTKSGSLWVAWVHENLLKGKCFWTVKKHQDCTYGWRTMLKLQEEARQFLRYEVGDGNKIFLWHDNWHPDGILFLKYGYRIVYDAASRVEAKVASVLKDKQWIWNPVRSDALVNVQSKLFLVDRKEILLFGLLPILVNMCLLQLGRL